MDCRGQCFASDGVDTAESQTRASKWCHALALTRPHARSIEPPRRVIPLGRAPGERNKKGRKKKSPLAAKCVALHGFRANHNECELERPYFDAAPHNSCVAHATSLHSVGANRRRLQRPAAAHTPGNAFPADTLGLSVQADRWCKWNSAGWAGAICGTTGVTFRNRDARSKGEQRDV